MAPAQDGPFEVSSSRSRASSRSTVRYMQEPFSTFKGRVIDLCEKIWPDVPPKAFRIEHMHGGAYNRVIGITMQDISKPVTQYILRIPREKNSRIEYELAALCYIRGKTTIPVPEMIELDLTHSNPVGEVYNIQPKIPGVRLYDVYMKISQTERLSIIRQLAQILREMRDLHSSKPGYLGATTTVKRSEDGRLTPEIKIIDFKINSFKNLAGEILWGGMADDTAKPKSALQLFIDQFDSWEEFGRRARRGENEDKLMEEFRKVSRQMNAVNLIGLDFCLFHPDFSPQNILVSKKEGIHQPEWIVSGILDWDGTAFVPYSVACTPPTWIWNWSDDDEEDEAVLCKTPNDREGRERKELFDSLMGPCYTEHAYSGGHRFVRRLFEFARDGFLYQHRVQDAKQFLADWEEKCLEIKKEFQWESGDARVASQDLMVSNRPEKRKRSFRDWIPKWIRKPWGACWSL